MSYYEGTNYQAKREDEGKKMYDVERQEIIKLANQKERAHYIDIVRGYFFKYDKEEISLSKLVELLNIDANRFARAIAKQVALKSLENAAEAHLQMEPEHTLRGIIESSANIEL